VDAMSLVFPESSGVVMGDHLLFEEDAMARGIDLPDFLSESGSEEDLDDG